MDQRVRRRRTHLSTLHQIRELVITMAHVSTGYRSVFAGQCFLGYRTVHTTQWQLEC